MAEVTTVIEGVAAGIGFIGAGAILKLSEEREVKGLTTAAGIWMTAAVGVAAGLGSMGIAIIGVVLAWIVLATIGQIQYLTDFKIEAKVKNEKEILEAKQKLNGGAAKQNDENADSDE